MFTEAPKLPKSLEDIVREPSRTRTFLTGRSHTRENVLGYSSKAVVIPISPNTDDIRNYMETRPDRNTEPEAMNKGLRADIVRIILENYRDLLEIRYLNFGFIEVGLEEKYKVGGGKLRGTVLLGLIQITPVQHRGVIDMI